MPALVNWEVGVFSAYLVEPAEWMIITEIGCCLRPLGIVLNEQRARDDLSFILYIRVNYHVLFK